MKDQALYLEADEDITSAIDKLAKSTGSAVQIVVPKRSTLLQSIINLKLLKKAAADSGKELVLVTSDKVATDLAARLGLAVAPSLGAKAVISEAAPAPTAAAEDIIEADDPEIPLAPEPPVVKPAKTGFKKPAMFARKAVEDKPAPEPEVAAEAVGAAAEAAPSEPKAKLKSKVPNFGKLQKYLFWGVLLVVLIVGYGVTMSLIQRATVTLYAAGTKVAVDTTFTVDPDQTTSSVASGVLAGQTVTFTKDLSQPITPTGTQDAGTKAAGQMTIYNNYDTTSHTLVAGTRLSAPDGKIFITNADVSVPGETLSGVPASIHPGQATVAVTAAANGDSYNEAPAKYTVVAYSGAMQTYIYGQGAQMSGGTTKTITVVAQADIDKAQTDLLAADKDASQKALDSHVPSGYVAMAGSMVAVPSGATSTPAVNTAATTATVTVHVSYTEIAVKQSDYAALVKAKELAQVGATNQIYDDGLSSAQLTSTGKDTSGRLQFHLSTQAYSGAKIDQTAVAKSLAGKKYGDASDIAGRLPGVQRVGISLTPSWVGSLPHSASKIKVIIQVASDN